MSASTFDDELAFERQLEERLAGIRRQQAERLGRFAPESQTWLALVPAWTDRLADACQFPCGTASLETFVEEAQTLGLCVYTKTPALDEDGSVINFWMPDQARSQTLRDLGNTEQGQHVLQRLATDIGQRILKVREEQQTPEEREKNPVSEMVANWAELASHAGDLNECSQYLIKTITHLVDAEKDTGRAQIWLAASKTLAQALGGSLEAARRVGENCIEREYRRTQDVRHLKCFKPINDQVEAFKRLLKTPDEANTWALHYLGHGGVGKTMLLRYITGRLLTKSDEPQSLPGKEMASPFSRIDFDYLSPEYPVRRPGQLLLELAAGLRPFITTESQKSQFDEFQNRALELHETLSQNPTPDNPLANIRHERFAPMLNAFTGFLKLLPEPVVLILDTCEELAKVRSTGGVLPTIEATFEILSRIHDGAPSVRVVFAGRRLLAQAGHHWLIPHNRLTEEEHSLPKRKDFLLLHEIRGFTEGEAEGYLAENRGLNLDEKTQGALFDNSLDSSSDTRIRWQPSQPDSADRYFNPFYLSLYAGWLKEDPELATEDILSGKTDPYIEMRIVNRITDSSVRDALPAAVLLRRFDKDMLLPALKAPEQLDEVYRKLSGQEWMNYQWDEELKANFLEIDRNLQDRLLAYYEQPARSHLLDEAKRKLGPTLGQLVREHRLSELTTDHVDAALRLLPAKQGAELWADFELRVAREGNWHRTLRATERILGEEGAVKDKKHPLRAAVLATHIAALSHVMPGTALLPDNPLLKSWQDVEQTADAHPDAELRHWLKLRAHVGRVAAFKNPLMPISDYGGLHNLTGSLVSKFWRAHGGELRKGTQAEGTLDAVARERMNHLAAAFCAAIEGLIERAEKSIAAVLISFKSIAEQVAYSALSAQEVGISPNISAFLYALAGRCYAQAKKWDKVESMFDTAMQIAGEVSESTFGQQRWLDWHAPASLYDRIVLERLRITAPLNVQSLSGRFDEWQHKAAGRLEYIDAEILVSFILKRQLAKGVVPAQTLEELARGETYRPNRTPSCTAHKAAQPLVCTLALGWLALGDADRALNILTKRIKEAGSTREDAPTVRAAERTKLHVIRRMRMYRRGSDMVNRFVRSSDPDEVLSIRQLIALNRSFNPDALLQPGPNSSPALLHAWWQSQTTLTREMAGDVVEMMAKIGRRALGSTKNIRSDMEKHLLLDWEEARLVAKNFKMAGLLPPVEWSGPSRWYEELSFNSVEEVRIGLRLCAFNDDLFPKMGVLANRLGTRLVAELALEEGEMMALRLPKQAASLLTFSYELFAAVKDHAGATIAAIRFTIADIHDESEGVHYVATQPGNLEVIQSHYERLVGNDSTLPIWNDLRTFCDKPTSENLSKLSHPSWEGWLHRLLRLMIGEARLLTAGGSNQRIVNKRINELRVLLDASYGQCVPFELALAPTEMVVQSSTGRLGRFLRILQSNWRMILTFTVISFLLLSGWVSIEEFRKNHPGGLGRVLPYVYIAGVGIICIAYGQWMRRRGLTVAQALGAGVITIIFLFLPLVKTLLGDVEALGTTVSSAGELSFYIPLLLSILTAAGVAFWIARGGWKWFRATFEAMRVALADIRLQISAVHEETAAGQTLLSARSVHMGLLVDYAPIQRLAPFLKAKQESVSGKGEALVLRPYREAAQDVPLEISNELLKLKDKVRPPFKMFVGLQVDPTLSFYPWEAMLILTMPAENVTDLLPQVHFWRQGEALAAAEGITYTNKVDLVTTNWGIFASTAWSPLKGKVNVTDVPLRIDKAETRKVLHLIGKAVNASAGLRLKLSDASIDRKLRPQVELNAPPLSNVATLPVESEMLIGTEDLPLDSTEWVIVQAEPVELTARSQTEREQAASLRAFAADVFAAGARGVLMLPAFPPEMGAAVLQLFTKLLTGRVSDLIFFFNTIEQMRRIIIGWPGGIATPGAGGAGDDLDETRLELALDLCVFFRHSRTK